MAVLGNQRRRGVGRRKFRSAVVATESAEVVVVEVLGSLDLMQERSLQRVAPAFLLCLRTLWVYN